LTNRSHLRIRRPATPNTTRAIRHVLVAFLTAIGVDEDSRDDIQTAVGEALANAAEHAYEGTEIGQIELAVEVGENSLCVDVIDEGNFIERDRRPGRGFGLTIVRAIARDVSVDRRGGTRVRMVFDTGHLPV